MRLTVPVVGVMLCVVAAHAGETVSAERFQATGWAGDPLVVGSADTLAAVDGYIQQASSRPAELRASLLPAGTSLARVEWVGSVLHVDVLLPAGASDWDISSVDLETLTGALGHPFITDSHFGGTVLRILTSDGRPWGEKSSLAATTVANESSREPVERTSVRGQLPRTTGTGATRGLGGPAANAARQPTGALSGVIIYTNGGHGWTADNDDQDTYGPNDFTWFLQRPGDLLDMNEDYGNIDQLNYFVHYAFNAGATVVPFRPVGHQSIEIIVDNSDPAVAYTGSWTANTTNSTYYGSNPSDRYRYATASATESATARYTPAITVTDFYPVYGFAIAGDNRTLQTYRVKHSGGITEVAVDHRMVGNGWVWLGEYYFVAGETNYVEITNESTETGEVIADAVRWGCGMGDTVRPGPGTISGYPRDEECARYWAANELGDNATGFDSGIWDTTSDDYGDNIATAARWAREMNQTTYNNDRWRRVYLEFHTNAAGCGSPPCSARGSMGLISDSPPNYTPTTYQEEFATFMADEIDMDMLILDENFEHQWYDRASSTYTSAYSAIRTQSNGNEFDATIIEFAFHDNTTDAELLRDSRVRSSMARSSLHGIIKFLNWMPDSTVPLAFLPDTPKNFRAEDAGSGDVVLSWVAPDSGEAIGDPATGYVVYVSTNGYGFGSPLVLGNVLTTTVSGVPGGQTHYFRVAATNAGGESMPTETLAVRRPETGTATVIIVNGFDALRRQQNPVEEFAFPPSYVGDTPERQMWRRTNSYDYVVQFADALEVSASSLGFTSCANETIPDLQMSLEDYDIALWILGTESTLDATFTGPEQARVSAFLDVGGAMFVSGADMAYDLIDQGGGASFMQDTFKCGFVANDAGTTGVTAAGGILSDVGDFDFDFAGGAPYPVYSPDVLSALTDGVAVLDYAGGAGVAGVQYDATIWRTVTFGFPFEAITSSAKRADIMQRIIDFLAATPGPLTFDYDQDGDVDTFDHSVFAYCMDGSGPGDPYAGGHFCLVMDGDDDMDVDFADWAMFQQVFTGALP